MTLEQILEQRGIGFEKRLHQATYTSQALAAEEHVSGYDVAKPVVVKGSEGFTMCVLPACAHVDLSRVAQVLHEKSVRLATEAEMAELFTDCELGAEPPVGTLFGMKTIMDETLRDDEFVTMQSGRHTESIKVRRADWEKVCEPTVARIAQA